MPFLNHRHLLAHLLIGLAAVSGSADLWARTAGPDPIREAREAFGRKDARRLAAAKDAAAAQKHPLAMWADYWEISTRISELQPTEAQAFLGRWPGTYVEDRFRNDWLLELGRRRDWPGFQAQWPKFRMNDDREVACYGLLLQAAAGYDVLEAARAAWLAQREADSGCALLATRMLEAGQLGPADAWRKVRVSTDVSRPRAARQALLLVAREAATAFDDLHENPSRYLAGRAAPRPRQEAELIALALIRLGASDPDAAAGQLQHRWAGLLPTDLTSWVWASLGRQAALKLSPMAAEYFQRAARGADESTWPEETLAWKARAALRSGRWQQAAQAINAMAPADQRDPTWVYWKAYSLRAVGVGSQDAESFRQLSLELLGSIAGQPHFYGMLAAEDLGRSLTPPAKPAPLTTQELTGARSNPGLSRALRLTALGLRSEGAREWNWTLNFGAGRRMSDRELLAAAQLACEAQLWDRCINTSERTQVEVDFEQRFPTPFRSEVLATARRVGVDPAYVYGLMRQESRFVTDAASGVGASGLMQVMPATARWTARKIGMRYSDDMLDDPEINIRLGTSYLKLMLDDLDGSQALAAAAYNAGPGRPRRWREGAALDAAIWVENIPFTETRDYVKKVLSNATWYAAVLKGGGSTSSLRVRLGRRIGPGSHD